MDEESILKYIIIEKGALNKLITIVDKITTKKARLVLFCDENTYMAAGKKVQDLLNRASRDIRICLLENRDRRASILVPDEDTVSQARKQIEAGADLLLAVGSGVINDITRYVATTFSLPFISIATAPSMDGYASSISPLIINGLKKSVPAKMPDAIVADIEVLINAPPRMKAAGFGDLIGKVIAYLDWQIAYIINQDKICKEARIMVQEALQACIKNINPVAPFNQNMIETLINGLIISGKAIALAGNSRAASGSEHNISHFLGMKSLMGQAPEHLHGEKVALGTYLMTKLYYRVFSLSYPEFSRIKVNKKSPEKREAVLNRAYGALASAKIRNWYKHLPDKERVKYLDKTLSENWDSLSKLVFKIIPSPSRLIRLLQQMHVPFQARSMGYSRELIQDTLICAKEYTYKYSLLDLLDELGLLEYFCKEIINEVY